MTKDIFKDIITELLNEYNKRSIQDRSLSKIFGGDSYIVQDYTFIDNMLSILRKTLNDEHEFIDWLFYENLVNDKTLTFTIEEKEYEGTIENVYDYLKGCL